jgi:hypothetical protein
MRIAYRVLAVLIIMMLVAVAATAQTAQPASVQQLVTRIALQENQFLTNIKTFSPLLETYIQELKPDPELGFVPHGDHYFIGRLDMSRGVSTVSFLPDKTGWIHRIFGPLSSLKHMNEMTFSPAGFATITPDSRGLDPRVYDFNFVRREFLGEVRTLVFDVTPKKGNGTGRFLGRIWVEDQGYNIVRFNGTYAPHPRFGYYFHFDSWRLNMGPNLWLPAYIYTEETGMSYSFPHHHLSFKAQSRLWGYNVRSVNRQDELTQVLVEPAPTVKDKSDSGQDLSPVQAYRQWQTQAEENVMDRLQRTALLAPPGEVDKVLDTVVNNIEISNKLDVEPEIHCHVLLTAPLESFSIGHTIVVSRGMLDVLPDEATLAAILAHEMGHILLQHGMDNKYAFSDRVIFPDQAIYSHLQLGYSQADENAADVKALELLQNSPYKDQLANAGLFLRALQSRAPELPNLLRAHLGNSLSIGGNPRMSQLIANSPTLDIKKMDQIAALPMGARIKVDPWSDKVELSKAKAVALLSPREKLMFEVTPVFPWLARGSNALSTEKVAASTPTGQGTN